MKPITLGAGLMIAASVSACAAPGPDEDGWYYLRCESVLEMYTDSGGLYEQRELTNTFRHNGRTVEIRRPGRWETQCEDIPERFAQACQLNEDALVMNTVAERWRAESRIDLPTGVYLSESWRGAEERLTARTEGRCRAVEPPGAL